MAMGNGTTGTTTLDLRIRWEGDTSVLWLIGDLDASVAAVVRDAITAMAAAAPRIVIDLSGVTSADDAGLQPIVDAVRRSQRSGVFSCRGCPTGLRSSVAEAGLAS